MPNLHSMNTIKLTSLLAVIFFIMSCGSPGKTQPNTEEVDKSPENNTTVEDTETNITKAEESFWGLYEGEVGLYSQQVVMELSIKENTVTGSYFYAKHRKLLQLNGSIDGTTNKVKLEEKYKGKTTGYLEFIWDEDKINGSWSKSPSSEKESLELSLLPIKKQEYNPSYIAYEKTILIDEHGFDNHGNDSIFQEPRTNYIYISQLNESTFCFHYHVFGRNFHMGTIEGIAYKENDSHYVFKDKLGCELQFTKSEKTIDVNESNCETHHGAFAYFDGTLNKK